MVTKIFNKYKKISPKKVFGNSEFCSFRQNHSRPNSLENGGFGGKNKTQSFQKLFGGYLFVFVKYLWNRSPKIKTKNIKNHSSILAIVNHRNWMDDSPPLRMCSDLLAPKLNLVFFENISYIDISVFVFVTLQIAEQLFLLFACYLGYYLESLDSG